MKPEDWNGCEVLFAFCGWLTCRCEPTVMGATYNAAPVVDLVQEFVKRHGLGEPREGWDKAIVPGSCGRPETHAAEANQ